MVRRSKSTETRYRNLVRNLTVEQIEVIATSSDSNEIRQTINKPNISDDSAFAIKRLVRSFLNRVEREDTRRIETEQTREVIQQVRERNITIARLEERIQQLQQENEQLRQQNHQLQQRTQELEERIQRLEEQAHQQGQQRRGQTAQADEDEELDIEELEDESDEESDEEVIQEEDFEGIEDSETDYEDESQIQDSGSFVPHFVIKDTQNFRKINRDDQNVRENIDHIPDGTKAVGVRSTFADGQGNEISVWKKFPVEDISRQSIMDLIEDEIDNESSKYEAIPRYVTMYFFF